MARLTEKVMKKLVGGYSKEGDYKKQTDPYWGTYNPISTKSPQPPRGEPKEDNAQEAQSITK